MNNAPPLSPSPSFQNKSEKKKSWAFFLARVVIAHYTLPVLMIYLVAGTIAQKYMGLYDATRLFFTAPLIWVWNSVPVPGFPVVAGVLMINLAFKLALKSAWRLDRAGVILAHWGAFLLLAGGLLTAALAREGYVDLSRGESKAVLSDYHRRDLVVRAASGEAIVFQTPYAALKPGQVLEIPGTGLHLIPLETCRHCRIEQRGAESDNESESEAMTYHGMARAMRLTAARPRANDEENMTGLTFAVQNETGGRDVYTVLENVPKVPELVAEGKTYRISLEKHATPMPFRIELLDFQRAVYPGTDQARTYESRVRIHDGAVRWESRIGMNEPLRYKGYTIYQASYIQTPTGDVSVLSVVWNVGRGVPYVAGGVMGLGLALHLFLRFRRKDEAG